MDIDLKELRKKNGLSQSDIVKAYKEVEPRFTIEILSCIESGIAAYPPDLIECVLTQCNVEGMGLYQTDDKTENRAIIIANKTILDLIPCVNEYSKNGITSSELQMLTGLKDREIRLIITELRKAGCNIVCFHDGGGYINTNNLKLIHRFVLQELSRANKTLEMAGPMMLLCRKAGYNV